MLRVIALSLALAAVCGAQEGSRVFLSRCQQCHDPNSGTRAPIPAALADMPWQVILASLETGAMKTHGDAISRDERVAVARYLGQEGPVEPIEMSGYCSADRQPTPTEAAWNGWGADLANTRFQAAESAGLTAADVPKLKLKWAFGFPNTTMAYGQPTIVGGLVYTGSNDGTVYALDAETGCIYWRSQASAMVRSAIVVGPDSRVYFGDLESNFYAVNAKTGEVIWQKKLDDQPFTRITGTAKLHDGKLYVPITSQEENAGRNPKYSCCTFRGNLVVINASDGSEVWRTFTTPEPHPTWQNEDGVQYYGPAGATIWSSPTLDLKRKLVYVSTGNGYSDPNIDTADAVIAMNMDTGAIRWSQQTAPDMFNWNCMGQNSGGGNCPENFGRDVDLGGSPVLADVGGGRQLLFVGQKTAEVHALDPDQDGKIIWTTKFGRGGPGGGIQWGIAVGDGLVFAGLGEARRDEPSQGGGMFAFEPLTGDIAWSTPPPKPSCLGQRGCSVAQKAPPSAISGVVFSGSMDGHLRAYDTSTGEITWDFDAAKDLETVNGVPGKGGSFNATGPAIANGMVYVNSGSRMPGNVLLAFAVE
jgi:polyvinyl alcohol dehydrogenase (cytochrome)